MVMSDILKQAKLALRQGKLARRVLEEMAAGRTIEQAVDAALGTDAHARILQQLRDDPSRDNDEPYAFLTRRDHHE
jgi:hypothetical protein